MKIPIINLVTTIMLLSSCTTHTISENSMITVSLTGEFVNRGDYKIPYESGLIEAIVLAGGFTDFANPKKVTIHGADEQSKIYVYDVKAVLKHEVPDPVLNDRSVIRAWGSEGFASRLLEPMKEYIQKSNQVD